MIFNKYIFYILILIMTPLTSLYCQQYKTEEQLFQSKVNYTGILKITPPLLKNENGNIDWQNISEKWRYELIQKYGQHVFQGYYGVLFIGQKVVLFTKLAKNDTSYISNFLTKDICLHIELSEAKAGYFNVKMSVDCEYTKTDNLNISINDTLAKTGDITSKRFGYTGLAPFINDIAVLPNLNNNLCFVIFRFKN